MGIQSHRELTVWQRGMDLAVEVYSLTRAFPPEETFGLVLQARKAASAIPANVAEGHGRGTPGDLSRSIAIARGELRELETHCELARRLNFVTSTVSMPACDLMDEVGRMLTSLLARNENRRRRR